MGFHKLINTRYFSEAAIEWKKNGGIYTKAPRGSRDYREYWELHEERCANGYSVGDLWIPGRHYWYLNFTPILKVPEDQLLAIMKEKRDKRGKLSGITADKVLEFPRFWEIDYEWYNFKHIAWHGGTFMGITSPGARHLSCAKTRGAGFSYKEASDGIYNYTFIPASKSYYFAGLQAYLDVDGILNKASGMIDFVNSNCPEWYQNRMEHATTLHQKASYIDEQNQKKGSMSEIIGVAINDPDKTRGKRGKKIVFEEAGSFRNLKKALSTSIASIMDGGITVGQISLFGTGGEEGPDIEGLEEIFDDPNSYDMLAFPNVWEPGMEHTECGYFVPCWRANWLYTDIEGSPEIDDAIEYELGERAKKKKAKDWKAVDLRQAEYPIVPSEVFKRVSKNPFRTQAIKAQILYVEKSAYIQQMIRYGKFTDDKEKGLLFVSMPKEKAQPVIKYPHTKDMNLEGCITIFERPFLLNNEVPRNMYTVIFDPYYKEESEDQTSLFAVYVLKQYNNIDSTSEGLPVANYVGRPDDLDTAYKALFDLCKYYNAKCQGEIAGGGQGVLDYAQRPENKLLNWVEFEPEMLHNKEIASNQKNRSYLMNMATERKRMGLTYLVDWHKQLRGINEKGNKILNLHRIYDLGLLYEMLKYSDKNADRISALIVGMFMLKEKAFKAITRHEEDNKENFFNRVLFSEYVSTGNYIENH